MKKYLLFATAFNNPVWKLDSDGKVELKDGNPVYLASDGREMIVGIDTISKLNAEAKEYREKLEAAQGSLKSFEGLDAKRAREAIELAAKVDQKKLIDSGEVDKVRAEISGQFTTQLTEKEKAIAELQSKLENTMISGVFNNSDFIRDSVSTPRDMFEATFRTNFKVEKGEVVAYDKAGNRLMSKVKAGEYASPDEALQLLVDMHPHKESILKAVSASGTGNNGGGGRQGGGRVIKRAEFDKMTPMQQAEISGKVRTGEMTLAE